jgi:23S rRNA pseudouridine2605 synthase
MRLNRFLAAAGLGSRRSCDQLISSGAVVINGTRIENLATQVNEDDDVRVNGRRIHAATPVTLLLHKPRGFVVTRSDERGRRTVYDLVPPEYSTLFHVGRLDKESEGLLLMTNDGALAQRLTHPSHTIEKEYEVTLDKTFDPAHHEKLLKGFHIEGGRAKFERLRILAPKIIQVTLRQGLKRQIRLMLYAMGYEVERLRRTRIGGLTDYRLPPGACRRLTEKESSLLVAKAATKSPRPKPAVHERPKPARRG